MIMVKGNPLNFLQDCNWDAPTILKRLKKDVHLCDGRLKADYPYLRGDKIGPLWLRMLRDNVEVTQLRNFGKVPIEELKSQAEEKGLYDYDKIIVLGGKNYVRIVKNVFQNKEIYSPLSDCKGIGYMMGKLKDAIEKGKSL